MEPLNREPQITLRLVEPSLPPLERHIEGFLEAKASKAETTVAFYRLPLYQYRDHVGPHLWPPTVESLNSYLASVKRRGCKPNTIYAYWRALRAWANWLTALGYLDSNPVDLMERPERPEKIPRAPRQAVLRQLFRSMAERTTWHANRDLAMFHLILDTGLRIGEAAQIEMEHIDREQREIYIPAKKTRDDRIVVYSRRAAPTLEAWLVRRGALPLPREVQALFVSHFRGRKWQALTADGMRQAFQRSLARARVRPMRVHDLRHAYAIYTLRNGGDIEDVQKQMGHRNLATTAIYTKADNFERGRRHDQSTPLKGIL